MSYFSGENRLPYSTNSGIARGLSNEQIYRGPIEDTCCGSPFFQFKSKSQDWSSFWPSRWSKEDQNELQNGLNWEEPRFKNISRNTQQIAKQSQRTFISMHDLLLRWSVQY